MRTGLLALVLAAGVGFPGAARAQAPPPPGSALPAGSVSADGAPAPLPPASGYPPPNGYPPPPASAYPVPPAGSYPAPPAGSAPAPPEVYYQPVPVYVSPPVAPFRQRARYAALSRGLSAGGGVLLAFGIFSLIGGGIVYGLSSGEVICGTAADPCDQELGTSYGLFAAGALMTSGGIAMLITGSVYRFRAIFGQLQPPLGRSFALAPAEPDRSGGATTGLRLDF